MEHIFQFLFEQIHGIDEYNGFYYDNPNIGQIYDRSQSDSEKRGSCLPASFEMAVEHLFLPLGRNDWIQIIMLKVFSVQK